MRGANVFKNDNGLEPFAKYVTHCPAICHIEVVFVLKKEKTNTIFLFMNQIGVIFMRWRQPTCARPSEAMSKDKQ